MSTLTRHSETQLPFHGRLLPAHKTSAWETKDAAAIIEDIDGAINGVVSQIAEHWCRFIEDNEDALPLNEEQVKRSFFNPKKDAFLIAIAIECIQYFSKPLERGLLIWDWLETQYPNAQVISLTELSSPEEGKSEMWIVPKGKPGDPVIDEIGICRNPTAIYRVIGI